MNDSSSHLNDDSIRQPEWRQQLFDFVDSDDFITQEDLLNAIKSVDAALDEQSEEISAIKEISINGQDKAKKNGKYGIATLVVAVLTLVVTTISKGLPDSTNPLSSAKRRCFASYLNLGSSRYRKRKRCRSAPTGFQLRQRSFYWLAGNLSGLRYSRKRLNGLRRLLSLRPLERLPRVCFDGNPPSPTQT